MNRDWRDFKSICGNIQAAREEFELVCEALFRKKYASKSVAKIALKQGDGGIDVYIGELGVEPITVIQCKFFLDAFDDPQKQQIRESFKTASTSEKFQLKEWILCIPREIDIDESGWWHGWKSRTIKENDENDEYIKLINGNELIDLLKENDLYNRVFKIDEAIKIDDIYKTVNELSNAVIPKSFPCVDASVELVLFTCYLEDSEKFYQARSVDNEFITSLKINNIWVSGESGKGKTALINRNLKSEKIEYIFCDLSPITITCSDDVLEDILYELEEKFGIESDSNEKNVIKRICKLILSCKLHNEIVIVVDELAVSSSETLIDISSQLVNLVSYYNNKSPMSSLKFVVSTISPPLEIIQNKAKASGMFTYISCDDWGISLKLLLQLVTGSLSLKLEEKSQCYILENSNDNPRLMKNIIRKITKSDDHSNDEVVRLTDVAIGEYF